MALWLSGLNRPVRISGAHCFSTGRFSGGILSGSSSMFLIGLAGTPPTTGSAGTSFVTTVPAATTAQTTRCNGFSPIKGKTVFLFLPVNERVRKIGSTDRCRQRIGRYGRKTASFYGPAGVNLRTEPFFSLNTTFLYTLTVNIFAPVKRRQGMPRQKRNSFRCRSHRSGITG